MEKEQFADKIKKLGYEVSFESGAVVVLGKYESYEENLAEIKKLVSDLGYDKSWGVRGGKIGAPKGKAKNEQLIEDNTPLVNEETDNIDVADENTSQSFEQMNLLDFLNN